MVSVAGCGRLGILEWAAAVVLGDSSHTVCDDQYLVLSILPESVAPVCRYRPYDR